MIQLHDVSKIYPGRDAQEASVEALKGVSFRIERGTATAIMGKSGCGKTTLLNLLAGLDSEYSGRIIPDEGGRPKTGYLFQTPSLIPWRNVLENAVLAPEIEGRLTSEAISRAHELIRRFDLNGFENSYPISLSQGMQQRVSLIRLLLHDPEFLLLDEAFSRVDPIFRRGLYGELVELIDQEDRTMVFVSHDIEEAVTLADNIIILSPRPGKLVREISIPVGRRTRIEEPIGRSDLLLGYFREVWLALNGQN